jgi:CRP/FNR family transcriptional regulator, cyclic AMP receptor protein
MILLRGTVDGRIAPARDGFRVKRTSLGIVDAAVRHAISLSHLHELPDDKVEELLAGALRVRIPAGAVTHREGDSPAHLELVLSGLVRVYVSSPDGRTMTIRYCRPGALMGAMSLYMTPFTMPATTQALVDAEILRLSAPTVRRLADTDVRAARALLRELGERAQSFAAELSGSAFATVRQKVARHLLDLAATSATSATSATDAAERHPDLAAVISQSHLADAVGTVREVVVRILRELRSEGIVRTGRDRIVILDPDRLIQEQASWNSGS